MSITYTNFDGVGRSRLMMLEVGGFRIVRRVNYRLSDVKSGVRKRVDAVASRISSRIVRACFAPVVRPLGWLEKALRADLVERVRREEPIPTTAEECTVERLTQISADLHSGGVLGSGYPDYDGLYHCGGFTKALREIIAGAEKDGRGRRAELAKAIYDKLVPEMGWGD